MSAPLSAAVELREKQIIITLSLTARLCRCENLVVDGARDGIAAGGKD